MPVESPSSGSAKTRSADAFPASRAFPQEFPGNRCKPSPVATGARPQSLASLPTAASVLRGAVGGGVAMGTIQATRQIIATGHLPHDTPMIGTFWSISLVGGAFRQGVPDGLTAVASQVAAAVPQVLDMVPPTMSPWTAHLLGSAIGAGMTLTAHALRGHAVDASPCHGEGVRSETAPAA